MATPPGGGSPLLTTRPIKGERRSKDGRGTPIPESSSMAMLPDDERPGSRGSIRFVDLPEPPSPQAWPRRDDPFAWESSQPQAGREPLSFARGRAPPLPEGVRSRNLDVGARIGRRPVNHKGRPGTEGSGTKKKNAMEEQMIRIENRQKADLRLEASRKALEKAVWERGLDSIPFLPGRWTEKLHGNVIRCLQECKEAIESAEVLYASAEAKDKQPDVAEVKEQLAAAELHAANSKRAWLVLSEAEAALQEAARKGWPHGEAEFEQAEAKVQEARECLLEIGEAGADDSGRVRPREKMLRKRILRILTVKKDCERRRSKVQVLLNRLGHAKWETRYQAMLEMAEIGRWPVPCSVTFLGDMETMVDEKEWQANSGRGDSQVVAGILAMMQDAESEVRRVVVDALPRVCPPGDPLVLESISCLTKDPVNKVKITAMEALANLSSRGDAMVVKNLCDMLEDADTAVRNLGVRLLPLVTQLPEDTLAIDQVLLRLDHARRFSEYPHWITEERDVRLAALKALSLITPQGHDKTTRRVVALLRNSWSLLIRDFTGCARSAEEPHRGSITDYGFSRGPISLREQLRAIEREAPCRCHAKCGEAAAAVRIAAIEVLVAIAVRHTHLSEQRQQLITAASEAAEAKERRSALGRVPTSGKSPGHSAGNSTSNSTSATPFSFSRAPSQPSKEDAMRARAQLKTAQDQAFGDLVRYTVVVEALCERLCDMDREVRWTAAQALVQDVASIDDPIVVEALAKSLEHSESEVQQLAIEMIKGSALGVCVTPGNVEMTDALSKRFVSSRQATRAAAARALMGHCIKGDSNAIYFLLPLLWHADSHVRDDTLVTLKSLAPKGDPNIVREVEKGAFEPDPSMRIMAIYALTQLADTDDNVTAALLEDLLFDQDNAVVCAATYAVAQLAPRGGADALDVLLNNCEDMSEAVRRASIEALTRISHKGDAAVVEAALKLVDDSDASVRKQALDTLTKIADRGNEKVCSRIIARLGTQGANGLQAIADLRDLRWSSARSLSFTFGSVGPPGTTHSGAFDWSQPTQGLELREDFRMPGGVPVTDGASVRSKTWGGHFSRTDLGTSTRSRAQDDDASGSHRVAGASVTWGPTQRLPTTEVSRADVEGFADAPMHSRKPSTSVIHLPFSVRPPTAPSLGAPLIFSLGAELHAVSRPGTCQSSRLLSSREGATAAVSKMARAMYSPLLVVDSDGGFDSLFGLVLLSLAGLVPQLVTTVHGMGEAVSTAVTIKRLYATLQAPHVAVVPSVDTATRHRSDKLCLSRPGTSLVRLDGSTRRVPSRFGPDYRRQLAHIGDHLCLAPLGISHAPLLNPPGLTLRVANLERDLRLLSMVAGADVRDLEEELVGIEHALEALNRRGKDYYAHQGRGLSRDGTVPRADVDYGGLDDGLGFDGGRSYAGTAPAHQMERREGMRSGDVYGGGGADVGGGSAVSRQAAPKTPNTPSKMGGILRPASRHAASSHGDRRRSSGGGRIDRVEIKTPDEEALARRRAANAGRQDPGASSRTGGEEGGGEGGGARREVEGGVEPFGSSVLGIVNEGLGLEGVEEVADGEAGGLGVGEDGGEKEAWEVAPVMEKEAWELTPPHSGGGEEDARKSAAGDSARLSTAVSSGTQDGRQRWMQEGGAQGVADSIAFREASLPAHSPPQSAGDKVVVGNRAVAALLAELAEHDEQSVTMLCMSSLTNLAGALEADPALVHSRIKNVVVMGGAARVSPSAWHDHAYYTQGGAEFNFYFDSDATRKVIHSGLEIIVVGLEVANADVCAPQELHKLVSTHLQLDKKEGAVSSPSWLLRTLLVAFDLSLSYAAVAAFQLVHPEFFRLERVWVSVDPHSGKLSEALPGTQGTVPVMLATDFRRDKYIEHLNSLINDDAATRAEQKRAAAPMAATGGSKSVTMAQGVGGEGGKGPATGLSLQERRAATTGRSGGLTLAGRDAARKEAVRTSGSKVLRLESVATSYDG
eukprot:Tamp_01043.p1 GENE.Tamp_01043~~Tamp_01043.p1  ORF type:complete len:1995 (-),score=479.41 Tamp_01043:85-6006(-)